VQVRWIRGAFPSPIIVTDAIDAGIMSLMDEEEARSFTPTEVLLYQHAQEWRGIHHGTAIIMNALNLTLSIPYQEVTQRSEFRVPYGWTDASDESGRKRSDA
jgi:hypothetical protein